MTKRKRTFVDFRWSVILQENDLLNKIMQIKGSGNKGK